MFTASWTTEALDELADVWISASPSDRDDFATGIERMNRRLERAPLEEGESRGPLRRVTFINGLTVHFEVLVPAGIARVLHVRWPQRP